MHRPGVWQKPGGLRNCAHSNSNKAKHSLLQLVVMTRPWILPSRLSQLRLSLKSQPIPNLQLNLGSRLHLVLRPVLPPQRSFLRLKPLPTKASRTRLRTQLLQPPLPPLVLPLPMGPGLIRLRFKEDQGQIPLNSILFNKEVLLPLVQCIRLQCLASLRNC